MMRETCLFYLHSQMAFSLSLIHFLPAGPAVSHQGGWPQPVHEVGDSSQNACQAKSFGTSLDENDRAEPLLPSERAENVNQRQRARRESVDNVCAALFTAAHDSTEQSTVNCLEIMARQQAREIRKVQEKLRTGKVSEASNSTRVSTALGVFPSNSCRKSPLCSSRIRASSKASRSAMALTGFFAFHSGEAVMPKTRGTQVGFPCLFG